MSKDKLNPGMVRCEVSEDRIGNITVKIEGHKGELFFQSDWDQAAFACNCGLIEESDPTLLEGVDLEDITQCPDDYIDVLEDSDDDDFEEKDEDDDQGGFIDDEPYEPNTGDEYLDEIMRRSGNKDE